MSMMKEYIFSKLHTDKRRTIPLFCSILLASAIIAIFAFIYLAQYHTYIDFAIEYTGEQHFVIDEVLDEEQLDILKENQEVAEVWQNRDYTYVKVYRVKDVYPISEDLAESIGLERTGYGVYNITYNRQLLGLYGIKDPFYNGITALGQLILMASAFILMVMILFFIIIGGAYAALGRGRQSEIGLLRSIGAAPKQIYRLLHLEILAYSIPAIIIGLFLGYFVQTLMYRFIFSFPLTIICIICVLITVYGTSSIQIRTIMKESIISEITGNANFIKAETNSNNQKKNDRTAINPANPSRSLARMFYRRNRRLYRLATIALTLFFTLIISFQTVVALIKANSYANIERAIYNVTIHTGSELPSTDTASKLSNMSEKYAAYEINTCSMAADEAVNSEISSSVWIYNGKSMLNTIFFGCDSETYRDYLELAGIDDSTHGAILVNNANGTNDANHKLQENLPLNNIKNVTMSARSPYDMENNIEITIPIAAASSMYPQFDTIFFPYDVVIVMELDEFREVDQALYGEESMSMACMLLLVSEDTLPNVKESIYASMNTSEGENVSFIKTKLDDERNIEESLSSTERFFTILIVFFGILGVSNVVNSIHANFEARRAEMVLLRSIGFDIGEERKMYMWEAAMYSFIPLIFSIPFSCFVGIVLKNLMLHMAAYSRMFIEFRWEAVLVPIIIVIIVIFAEYLYPLREKKRNYSSL